MAPNTDTRHKKSFAPVEGDGIPKKVELTASA